MYSVNNRQQNFNIILFLRSVLTPLNYKKLPCPESVPFFSQNSEENWFFLSREEKIQMLHDLPPTYSPQLGVVNSD
jgi:hypothetical protein